MPFASTPKVYIGTTVTMAPTLSSLSNDVLAELVISADLELLAVASSLGIEIYNTVPV